MQAPILRPQFQRSGDLADMLVLGDREQPGYAGMLLWSAVRGGGHIVCDRGGFVDASADDGAVD